jgi:hypothetical protein
MDLKDLPREAQERYLAACPDRTPDGLTELRVWVWQGDCPVWRGYDPAGQPAHAAGEEAFGAAHDAHWDGYDAGDPASPTGPDRCGCGGLSCGCGAHYPAETDQRVSATELRAIAALCEARGQEPGDAATGYYLRQRYGDDRAYRAPDGWHVRAVRS